MDPTEPKLKKDTVKTSREEREVGGKRTEKLTSENNSSDYSMFEG